MTDAERIVYNRPHVVGGEAGAIAEAVAAGHLSGNGPFSRRCADWLCAELGAPAAFILPSCTAALEMAVLLAGVGPGDEVVMPSFTFVSTANAVVLRGGTPVFCDVREDTLNLDERLLEDAITERTKAVIVVHYAGVGAEMEAIAEICRRRGVLLIEDAAHCLHAWYRDRALGAFGQLATFSFHETKNVQCGEGGALVINDPNLVEHAEIVQEKGTNRRRFLRGQVDKYTWVEAGSSFLTSEVTAAFLWVQMDHSEGITERRRSVWERYHEGLAPLEEEGLVRRPHVPADRRHNAHLYSLRLPTAGARDAFIAGLDAAGVQSVFHYVPLHDAPAGRRFARAGTALDVTEQESAKLARLPIWVDLSDAQVERVIAATTAVARDLAGVTS
jgi:dTDP-4-amino-4,6-dideoxygalactose transaminase